MKNYIKLFFVLISVIGFTYSCNDDFMDRVPESELTSETFWTSEASLDIYNKGIYEEAGNNGKYSFMLGYYSSTWGSGYKGMGWEDCQSDNGAPNNSNLNEYAEVASGQHVVDANPDRKGWNWDLLRRVNYGLANYDKTPIAQAIINQYVAEARLFRAWFYFDKVKRFGDVPWIDEPLTIESEELYASRDPRAMVMQKVLEDLNFAVANLPEGNWSSGDRFDKYVALALKSRVCLYEGTHMKHHNRGDATMWLQEAANAALKIMESGMFTLFTTGDPENDYNTLFRQLDLTGNSETIAFRKYIRGINGHRFNGYQQARPNGMTKDLIEDYLCTDGLPTSLSAVYQGNLNLSDEFANRDPRLRQTALHPDDTQKYLSMSDYNAGIYPRFIEMSGGWRTTTGYTMIKYFDLPDFSKGYGGEENDAILFRLAEVYLNYAEAKEELGTLTQSDLDMSINKLRERVGMPNLEMGVAMDPKYAGEGISAMLVEIRRERRIEMAYEGFRYDDIIRWRKGEYLTKRILGMRFEDETAALYPGITMPTYLVNGEKYIDVYANSIYANRTFDPDKHYLFPIAISVISQNNNITQNPNW